MLFSAKPKGFYVELTDTTLLLAQTGAGDGPTVVEEIAECSLRDETGCQELVQRYLPKGKGGANFVRAACGIYPPRRIIRRATIEPKRVKDPGYLNEFAATQFKIEADRYTFAILNAADGTEYDMNKAAVKDVIFCGLPNDDVVALQEQLLEKRIYPERLELASVSSIGALASYARVMELKAPVLVLEIGMDATHTFIISGGGLDGSRVVPQGFGAMLPVVQKELGLKDEESARKLFFSNTFDFTGMGAALLKRLVRELQSSIGFHEVQTGQSIGSLLCLQLPPKLEWLEGAIGAQLGVSPLKLDLGPWLESQNITILDTAATPPWPGRWLGLFSLMARNDALVPAK
jgi:hypothetical protein